MGFNSVFKGLNIELAYIKPCFQQQL